MTDRWTDDGHTKGRTDGKNNVALAHPTVRGSDVARMVEFRPVVQEEIA